MDGVNPVSLNVVPLAVPIWEKLLQPAPWQRSTKYVLMVPPVSVAGLQETVD
jgi:hypothetical protein